MILRGIAGKKRKPLSVRWTEGGKSPETSSSRISEVAPDQLRGTTASEKCVGAGFPRHISEKKR